MGRDDCLDKGYRTTSRAGPAKVPKREVGAP